MRREPSRYKDSEKSEPQQTEQSKQPDSFSPLAASSEMERKGNRSESKDKVSGARSVSDWGYRFAARVCFSFAGAGAGPDAAFRTERRGPAGLGDQHGPIRHARVRH